jgi:hypothetical protein
MQGKSGTQVPNLTHVIFQDPSCFCMIQGPCTAWRADLPVDRTSTNFADRPLTRRTRQERTNQGAEEQRADTVFNRDSFCVVSSFRRTSSIYISNPWLPSLVIDL